MQLDYAPLAPAKPSKAMFWTDWVLSILPALLLFFSASAKLTRAPQAVEGFKKMNYPDSALLPIGIAEVACTVIYLIPRTSVLGAILLAGYLGGATNHHVRAGESIFFAPVLIGVVVWLGLYLRDPRLRALVPFRSKPSA